MSWGSSVAIRTAARRSGEGGPMRAGLRGMVVLAAAGVATLALPGAVPGAAAGGFEGGSASARAEAVRVQVDSPGAPATDRPVEFGFPSSSARVNGLAGSSAMAAMADPGGTVLNGPGLCKVAIPQCPQMPDYPFIVDSNYGTKNEAKAAYGPTSLEAVSQAAMSKGSATTTGGDPKAAGGQNASVSTGTIDPDTGIAKAEAATITDTISFGDTLKIGSVHSSASVTQEPGKELVRQTSLEVKGLVIAGQAVGITQSGLVVGSNPTPLPAGNPFDQALAQAGIKLRWLGGYDTKDGVVAPALEIAASGQMPGLPAPSILTVRLGYAMAEVEAGRATAPSLDFGFTSSAPSAAAPSPEAPSPEAPSPVAATAPAASASPGVSTGEVIGSDLAVPDVTIAGRPLDLSGVTTMATAEPASSPELAAAPPEVATLSTSASAPAPRTSPSPMAVRRAAAVLGIAPSDSGRTLYVVLGAGAVLALAFGQLSRRLGARVGGRS